ncbi:MAG: hypothetical protein KGV59_01500 [Tenacibaculum sp.]|nr:hypothetical protein [Tenacibaculum sp.]
MEQIYYRHTSGIEGVFLQEYKPTGKPLTLQIKCYDGRIFYAPKIEFTRINPFSNPKIQIIIP